MTTTLRALLWEIAWKNRVVFPALLVLFGLAVGLAVAGGMHAEEQPWWLGYARGIMLFAFLASLLLAYAPFTLMESQPGWRMNSMTTRWFVLPVRTAVLVVLPLAGAVTLLALVLAAWLPLLGRTFGPGLDGWYFFSALALGVVLLQAVAWTVPRRPGQYWAVAGVVLPAALLLAVIPQDQPGPAPWRHQAPGWFALAALLLTGFALHAAACNRRGDWPGHVPFERWRLRRSQPRWVTTGLSGPGRGLFHSDVGPAVRFHVVGWLLLAAAVLGLALLSLAKRSAGAPLNLEILVYSAVHLLPFLGVLWLAVWGLALGCEPGSGFRTSFSSFRGTLPVTPGQLAGPRLAGLVFAWLVVWVPLVLAAHFILPRLSGVWDYEGVDTIQATMAWRMALSAHLVAGALPLLLWGRLEGFPNLLLAGMGAWAGTWLLAGFLGTKEPGATHWIVAGVLLALKAGVAAAAFRHGLRRRWFGARYLAGVLLGWALAALAVASLVSQALPEHTWRLLSLIILLPLARLALCPAAVAANRCR
jgi:hypothetical protein